MRILSTAFLCLCMCLAPQRGTCAPSAASHRGLTKAEQEANALTDRANDMQQRGFINEAIRYCQEALAIDPVPKRHRNLAILLEQAGRLVEALAAYQRFQRDQLGEIPEYRQNVAEHIDSLMARLGTVVLEPLPPSDPVADRASDHPAADFGRYKVKPEIRLLESESDRPTCLLVTPADGAVQRYLCQPGLVHAELLIAGQVAATRGVEVAAGKAAQIAFRPRTEVTISSNRARPALKLDQAPLSLLPAGRLPLTLSLLLGTHELEARDGKEVLRRELILGEGLPQTVKLTFKQRPWLPWVIGGVALVCAAGIATGVALYLTQPQPPTPDILLPPPSH